VGNSRAPSPIAEGQESPTLFDQPMNMSMEMDDGWEMGQSGFHGQGQGQGLVQGEEPGGQGSFGSGLRLDGSSTFEGQRGHVQGNGGDALGLMGFEGVF
jgi:hypothetical protein